MVNTNLRLDKDEVERLEKILDGAFGTKGKKGIKSSSKDLFSKERFGGMMINYSKGIELQARLNGDFYDVDLRVNTNHQNYTYFLEECRTKMRRVYDELTSSRNRVASAI